MRDHPTSGLLDVDRSDKDLEKSPERGALAAVHILIPVWGYRYIQQFLEFCAPTLIAPGNIPAIAAELPCRIVLMTRAEDLSLFEESRVWQKLQSICEVDLQFADDLITDSNHTAVITLAYARAVRSVGEAMLNTLFIFLVSDYIMADGSLRSVLRRVQSGASAVLAGNFQIVAEEAIPIFRRRISASSLEVTIRPRELMSWSLTDLHPATAANMVNFTFTHNEHSNRLFWRVDEHTLLGRFYLMHMIGIRPEVTEFSIGASCDYSFVPEMCPSDNVVILDDSDDYLVVEMQPRDHEAKYLRLGPTDPKRLALSLEEWTTARHRKNAQTTLVFHAGAIPKNFADVARESDEFIEAVSRHLTAPPQPYRMHPYWVGSIAAHRAMTLQAVDRDELRRVIGPATFSENSLRAILWRLRGKLFGYVPNVTPLHPRWADFRRPKEAMSGLHLSPESSILVVAEQSAIFAYSFSATYSNVHGLEVEALLNMPETRFQKQVGAYDACLVFMPEKYLRRGDELITRLAMMVKPGMAIFILLANDRELDAIGFRESCAYHAGRFLSMSVWAEEIRYVCTGRLRMYLERWLKRYLRAVRRRPAIFLPLVPFIGVPLAVGNTLLNFSASHLTDIPDSQYCSSVFMSLRVTNDPSKLTLPTFEVEKVATRVPKRVQLGAPQENSDHEFWHNLPEFVSCSQFVGSLVAERRNVCQVGFDDFVSLDIILRNTRRLTLYDTDPIKIGRVERRHGTQCSLSLNATIHDLRARPLPQNHDTILCTNVLETVSPADEQTFFNNLKQSLSNDAGILIVGCSQNTDEAAGAEAADKPYYLRGGAAIHTLVRQYFDMVLMFSVVHGVVLPGSRSGADYIFALCSGRRS